MVMALPGVVLQVASLARKAVPRVIALCYLSGGAFGLAVHLPRDSGVPNTVYDLLAWLLLSAMFVGAALYLVGASIPLAPVTAWKLRRSGAGAVLASVAFPSTLTLSLPVAIVLLAAAGSGGRPTESVTTAEVGA
jgi:hypothetical protein